MRPTPYLKPKLKIQNGTRVLTPPPADTSDAQNVPRRLTGAGLTTAQVPTAVPLAHAEAEEVDVATLLEAAISCLRAGEVESGETLIRAVLFHAPDHAVGRNALAYCLINRQAFEEAAEEAAAAIRLDPMLAPAHNNLGLAMNALGRSEAAVEAYSVALKLDPQNLNCGLNLSVALETMGKLDDALARIDATRLVHPASPEVYYNRANVLQKMRRYTEALESYETATELAPDNASAHFSYGLCLLLTGRYAEGWREYEWRWRDPAFSMPKRSFPMPQWRGEDLKGRSIFVHAEQGLGDAIQFARYVRLLQAAGAEVITETFTPMAELFRTMPGNPVVQPLAQPMPATDFHCPFMSLPLALLPQHPEIPADIPYLGVPEQAAAQWKPRFDQSSGPNIGVVHCGNPRHHNDAQRSIHLELLANALPPGPRYYILATELRESDADVLRQRPDIVCLKDDLRDFSDTAAACSHMDLIVSVDTSVAHLAGALACPLLLLAPFHPDWRWGPASETCAWYPTARLLRQTAFGDWSAPLASVTEAVRALQHKGAA